MRSKRKEAFSKVDLYPVTSQRLSAGRSNIDVLKAVIKGGSRIIQLRETDLADEALYKMAISPVNWPRNCSSVSPRTLLMMLSEPRSWAPIISTSGPSSPQRQRTGFTVSWDPMPSPRSEAKSVYLSR
jgi:hypothetical protein